MVESIPAVRPRSLPETLPYASAEAVDLIAQCVALNPSKRIDVGQALMHPFMAEFHDPEDEPSREGGPVRLETDDNTLVRPTDYRRMLYAEIERRRQDVRQNELGNLKKPSQAALRAFDS
jgi:mitogen-activated protein kinase 15